MHDLGRVWLFAERDESAPCALLPLVSKPLNRVRLTCARNTFQYNVLGGYKQIVDGIGAQGHLRIPVTVEGRVGQVIRRLEEVRQTLVQEFQEREDAAVVNGKEVSLLDIPIAIERPNIRDLGWGYRSLGLVEPRRGR